MSTSDTSAEKTPVEVFPELLEVWEVTHTSSIGKLVLALAKAQLEFKSVLKQNENAAFTRGEKKSFYADLATYIDATQEALAKQELVVMQWPDVSVDAKSMSLISILAHSSGEWMRGKLTLPALGRDGFTAQSCGSSITYARRYSYAAITGCAAEDDDANSASGRGTREAAQAVGEAKVAELKKSRQKAPEAQAEPSQLCVYPHGDGFEVTGEPATMNLYKDVLLSCGEKTGTVTVMMSAEQLDTFRHEFCEVRGGILTTLKAQQ